MQLSPEVPLLPFLAHGYFVTALIACCGPQTAQNLELPDLTTIGL
jgi:hypothetical protein